MRLIDFIFNYLEEQKIEKEIEDELVEFDSKNSPILRPRQFLKKYTIEPLAYMSISFSYALSEIENKKIEISTQEIGIEEKTKTNIASDNAINFLKDFKTQLKEFCKDAPPVFSIKFEWALKNNINKRYLLEISIKNSDPIKIGGLSNYEETENKNQKIMDQISKFIKKNNQYIRNSPINLLASIIIYNDWKYNWNIDIMQKDLNNRARK